ncbi:chromosome-anchoring protein RacA [Anaerobacillus sp. CMMVII]|uniref:chromosome-anchoring protein RacA n=1 Tax=Anaerobacillus sp. CMMVII TaxID=2755588 RepID=UPI0021B7A250|nr:chromosome-anchoring protein RacA [Anaerobacillus sp. CMMVII]MCT8138938.1 chromosome-anchoring protein RacA [Anaerobacillus sp. CMMVII]
MEKILKTKEVSEELGVNPTTVQRWIKYFDIPCKTNELGHYLIAEQELNTLQNIKERLNRGFTMKEIREKNDPVQVVKEKKEKMIATNILEDKLEQLMIHIEQLERKLSVKADEVVEYQVLQHRNELDNLFTMITKIDERMNRIEQQLPVITQKVVGGSEHNVPEQLKKPRKNKLMRIFSF